MNNKHFLTLKRIIIFNFKVNLIVILLINVNNSNSSYI